MLRKLLCMSLIAMPAVGLSGCSSMWTSVGNFSEFMAEKTKFSSPLRGSKTQEVKFETENVVEYTQATVQENSSDNFDTSLYASQTTTPVETAPVEAPLFDADGNYIGSPTVPCPDGTYLTADDTCMFLEQTDYSQDFTQ